MGKQVTGLAVEIAYQGGLLSAKALGPVTPRTDPRLLGRAQDSKDLKDLADPLYQGIKDLGGWHPDRFLQGFHVQRNKSLSPISYTHQPAHWK